jgi:protein SCO1/2
MTDRQTSLDDQQRNGVRYTVIAIVVFICVVMGLFLNKISVPRILSDADLRLNGTFVFEKPRIFKDFTLRDQHGDIFKLQQLEGKWSLLFFGYTGCPDICPTTMTLLKQVKDQLNEEIREQVQFIMVSVDPARDTVDVLAQYIPYFDAEFIGLTGEFLDVKRFATQLNAAFMKVRTGDDPQDYSVDHSANIVLINPKGHYHGFIRAPLDGSRIKLTLQSIVTRFN